MKRGFAVNLGIVIVSLVVLVMILFLLQRTGSLSFDNAKYQTCKQSVEMSAVRLKAKGSDFTDRYGNSADIKCFTEYLTVPRGKEKPTLAKAMYLCYDQYGHGTKEIFDTEDNTYCAICYQLTFKDTGGITGFSEYLGKARAPTGRTYVNELNNVEMREGDLDVYENPDLIKYDVIDTSNPLAVIFVMGKDAYSGAWAGIPAGKPEAAYWGSIGGGVVGVGLVVLGIASCPFTGTAGCVLALGVIGAGAGGTLGYMAGADNTADWDASILVWDYTKLDELECTKLEGDSVPLQEV